MTENYIKLQKITENYRKLQKITENDRKCLKMPENDRKCHKKPQNDTKCNEMTVFPISRAAPKRKHYTSVARWLCQVLSTERYPVQAPARYVT